MTKPELQQLVRPVEAKLQHQRLQHLVRRVRVDEAGASGLERAAPRGCVPKPQASGEPGSVGLHGLPGRGSGRATSAGIRWLTRLAAALGGHRGGEQAESLPPASPRPRKGGSAGSPPREVLRARGGDCQQLISGAYEDTAALRGARAAPGGSGPATYPDRAGLDQRSLAPCVGGRTGIPLWMGDVGISTQVASHLKATTLDTCGVSYCLFSQLRS